MKHITTILMVLCATQMATSQVIPFDSDQWEIQSDNYVLEEYKGYNSVYLKSGVLSLKDDTFINGIIEFDILMSERRSFPGVFFRLIDPGNYEEFYMRPHLSGQPDANQYTPIFNGNAAWQLYFGPSFSAPTVYPFGEWMHVKILVLNDKAEIYLNNSETPLAVDLKRTPQAGRMGLKNALTPMHFANFQYQKTNNVSLKGTTPIKEKVTQNKIDSWQISDPFKEVALEGTQIPNSLKTRKWEGLTAEVTGTVNISKIRPRDREVNTVFAKIIITSNKKQVKKIDLGYSDRVKVYLNDQLLYEGNNTFRTRDYRYLGTIGFFDAVYLPLKKGRNELWVAVSENFGGWGLRGVIENRDGIEISAPKF